MKSLLLRLKKKHLISKKPNPIIPFLLTGIAYVLSYYAKPLSPPLSISLLILTILTLFFAIIHLSIYKILTKK